MDTAYCADQIRFVPMDESELAQLNITDPYWDDAWRIGVTNGAGEIAYANERSALLAVYDLLRAAGCAFLRPGPMGEIVPECSLSGLTVQMTMRPKYRHRGICIEGSVSLENVLDMVDYAAKAGYNAYFTQFRESYTFFERWYTHKTNDHRQGEPISVKLAQEMIASIVSAAKRRGLLYHAVGHGWTCEPLGIPGLHWEDDGTVLTDEQRRHLALVNGKRELYEGIALNTSLCYSNPETRTLMARAIADYAQENPAIDVMHVWLADANNNQCECDECRKKRPSDFYIDMLNETDALLTERGLPTKVVFLIYYDLLFPPEETKLNNPDRFILMYAPITRSFSQSFRGLVPVENIPPYERNRLSFSRDVAENLGYLSAWQRAFQGDSFDYDYHIFYGPNYDPGHMVISRVLYDDIAALESIGLNGMVNCQLQRVSMPHGFGLFIGGQAMCDPSIDYDKALETYFAQAYGKDAPLALEVCQTLSRLFPMDVYAQSRPEPTAEDVARLRELHAWLAALNLPCPADAPVAQQKSWRNLAIWRQIILLLCEYLIPFSLGEDYAAAWLRLSDFVWEQEPLTQSELDAYHFLLHYRRQQACKE